MSETKKIITSDTLPINYEGQKWLNWFISDSQILQNFCHQIFRGGQSSIDQNFFDLLAAANNSISEIEDDIVKIKEFLAIYNK